MHNFDEFEAITNHIMDGLRWGLTIFGVSKAYREWKEKEAEKKNKKL